MIPSLRKSGSRGWRDSRALGSHADPQEPWSHHRHPSSHPAWRVREGGLPCRHPLSRTHTPAQAALPTLQESPLQPVTPPGTGQRSYRHRRRCHSPAIGHLVSLIGLTPPATDLLPCTTGKPTRSPWLKPALPTGDRACTHAYKYIYMCIFAYICGDGTIFFF